MGWWRPAAPTNDALHRLGVVAVLATLSVPVGVAARPLGPSGPWACTIFGTDGNDVLRGTPAET